MAHMSILWPQQVSVRIGYRAFLFLAVAGLIALSAQSGIGQTPAGASLPSLCGNAGPAPTAPQHVIVVMMENASYNKVVGSSNAPFQTGLANQCGVATSAFGATHTSAANYLALSAGQYPAKSTPGCGTVKACSDASDNLYSQLSRAGLSWTAYEESMPAPCSPVGSGTNTTSHTLYSIGHNPPIFYSAISPADCVAHDIGVPDLTAQSGAFWNDLQNQTLAPFSFVTPSAAHDNEGPGTTAQAQRAGDTWLQHFVATVSQSASYQSGNTLLLVDYDEGNAPDSKVGENCTNQTLDLPLVNGVSAQDSCHIPLFVVYPYTPTGDHEATFFDLYSVTRTVQELFGLPLLAHAGDAQTNSLLGSFGIPVSGSPPPPPPPLSGPVSIAAASCTDLTCVFDGSASTDDSGAITTYAWDFGDGTTDATTGATPTHTYAGAGTYHYTLTVTDDQSATSATAFQGAVTVSASQPPPGTAIGFRAAAHSYNNAATTSSGATITEPQTIATGDAELLVVASAAVGATRDPAGWTKVMQQTASPLQTTVYSRVATSTDAGSTVRVPMLASAKVALELVDYSGALPPIQAIGTVDSSTASHIAPATSIAIAGSWVVNCWSDRSSTTTGWTLPGSVTGRDAVIGQGGGHPAAASADSGAPAAVGAYPANAAQVIGGASGKGAMFTLVLTPAG